MPETVPPEVCSQDQLQLPLCPCRWYPAAWSWGRPQRTTWRAPWRTWPSQNNLLPKLESSWVRWHLLSALLNFALGVTRELLRWGRKKGGINLRWFLSPQLSLAGGLDMLILNHISYTPLGMFSNEIHFLRRSLDINLLSYVVLSTAALPMLKQTNGSIVVVSSIAGEWTRGQCAGQERPECQEWWCWGFCSEHAFCPFPCREVTQ